MIVFTQIDDTLADPASRPINLLSRGLPRTRSNIVVPTDCPFKSRRLKPMTDTANKTAEAETNNPICPQATPLVTRVTTVEVVPRQELP